MFLLSTITLIFFYVHGTAHLGDTSFIKYQRDATYSVYFVYFFYNSTCFGRSPRPSSGVIFANCSGSHWCVLSVRGG